MTRVLRVYHAGRDPGHRRRERALQEAGVEVTLVVPERWPDSGAEQALSDEPFEVVELPVQRPGDVNRHRWPDRDRLAAVLDRVRPDLVDVHAEPFSVSCRQWLAASGPLATVCYTAQNVDKRFPPPFAQWERAALRRLRGLYPCSRQAASVARGKGFAGPVDVLPLGYDDRDVRPAGERPSGPVVLGLVGNGPEREPALHRAAELGVGEHVEVLPWQSAQELAALYRRMHVVLVPSRATATWVEQFGRVIVEAQAGGAVVAAYASGAIPEVAGGTGLLAPEGEWSVLADRVAAALSEPGRLDELRAAGLAACRDRTWTAVGRRQAAFYRRVLDGSAAPVPTGRAAAVREFGATAPLAGGASRPFALPVLREDRPWTRALGAGLDRLQR